MIKQCYSDMGIPIPKPLLIWVSSSHITLAIWGMPISLGLWEWGCSKCGDDHITVISAPVFATLEPRAKLFKAGLR